MYQLGSEYAKTLKMQSMEPGGMDIHITKSQSVRAGWRQQQLRSAGTSQKSTALKLLIIVSSGAFSEEGWR